LVPQPGSHIFDEKLVGFALRLRVNRAKRGRNHEDRGAKLGEFTFIAAHFGTRAGQYRRKMPSKQQADLAVICRLFVIIELSKNGTGVAGKARSRSAA
jgi:hypothetical protein